MRYVARGRRPVPQAGPRVVPLRASAGHAAEWACASRPGAEKKKRGRKGAAGLPVSQCGKERKMGTGPIPGVGPEWKKMNFSKSNHFPNLFPLFSVLSQIQM